ncbi:recombinase family protein [Streptomyces olivaceus]|uniref:recombinase family protein n=1 Tax=Streptomyces olivaceus TaxID=47716 RepID=UPI001CCC5397|nr:recombinase family protein [Streptomyces olivaceus]MBZ6258168.1 recombinase family protein [Streptomyces olivaceus]
MLPRQATSPPRDLEPWLGYIRVSTWKEEKISPELQETAIESWARRTGRRIVGWITDLDATGRNFKRRIMQGIEQVEHGEPVGIAVWKFSRFGRNDLGIAINLARLEHAGGQLASATEDVDARTAVGRFNRAILFDLAVFESDRAGEQWKETHAHRRALKLPATGRPRFGYIWHPRRIPDATAPGGIRLQDERYERHPDLGPIGAELYERKLEREGFAALAHWLNDELGIPTTRGNRWAPNTVQRYLDSGFAAGLLYVHDPECTCGLGRDHFSGCTAGRMIYVAGAQPALITPEQWEDYQKHRTDTKNTPPRARRATYSTTGIGACGNCHGTAVARSSRYGKGDTLVCYNHKNKGKSACETGLYVRRDEVEQEIRLWLKRDVAEDVDSAPAMPSQRTVPPDPRKQAAENRARLQAELAKADAALDRLVTDHVLDPDKYPSDTFGRVRDQLMKRKEELVKDLQAVEDVETTPDRADFRPLAVGLLAEWDTITDVEKNAFLRQLLRRVVVTCTKADQGAQWALHRAYEFHPVFEPDPWADR